MRTDDELVDDFTTVDATARQRERMQARVFDWLDAHDTPLAVEWLRLVTDAPLAALGLGTLSAASVVVTPPVLWLARAFL